MALVVEMLEILEHGGLGLRSPTLQPCALEFHWDHERDQLHQNIDLSMSLEWTGGPMLPKQGDMPKELTQEKSPPCTDLITDPGTVLPNKERWPTHLCVSEFLEQSTTLWAVDRPFAPDSLNSWRWASMYPLPVGRRALMIRSEMTDVSAWSEVVDVLPFEEYEQAMWALRIEEKWRPAGKGALEIFGLAAYPTERHQRLGHPVAGDLAYVVRGQGRHLLELLDAAEKWWRQFRGLTLPGRPKGSGRWTSRQEFEAELRKAVAAVRSNNAKPTQENVAPLLHTSARHLRSWMSDYHIAWKEIVG